MATLAPRMLWYYGASHLLFGFLQVDDAEAKWHKHQDYKKATAPEVMSN